LAKSVNTASGSYPALLSPSLISTIAHEDPSAKKPIFCTANSKASPTAVPKKLLIGGKSPRENQDKVLNKAGVSCVQGRESTGAPEKLIREKSCPGSCFTRSIKACLATLNLLGATSLADIDKDTSNTICKGAGCG
jgi:hypothetical protein